MVLDPLAGVGFENLVKGVECLVPQRDVARVEVSQEFLDRLVEKLRPIEHLGVIFREHREPSDTRHLRVRVKSTNFATIMLVFLDSASVKKSSHITRNLSAKMSLIE